MPSFILHTSLLLLFLETSEGSLTFEQTRFSSIIKVEMETKFKIEKDSVSIDIQLFEANQLILISVFQKDAKNTLLFEQSFDSKHLKNEGHLICSSWPVLCQAISHLAQYSPSSIVFKSQGTVTINYTVNVVGSTINKEIEFPLKKRMDHEQQVRILRGKVTSYDFQLKELRDQVSKLKIENQTLSSRMGLIEQKLLRKEQKMQFEPVKTEQIQQTIIKDITPEEKEQREEKKENKSLFQVAQTTQMIQKLGLDINPNCLYFDRFKIEGNTISSLIDDNYQVYWKKPLPNSGIVKVLIKTKAKNHCSIGILTESELQNKYSFQSKNSICLYTYYQGLFRGLYFRGQYYPLQWMINVNEVIEFQIDMNKRIMTMGLQSSKHAKQIDIDQLAKSQPLYFFLEMYQKDGVMQFL